jgi:hypothetical protein
MQSSERCKDQEKGKRSPSIRSPGKVRISELERVCGVSQSTAVHMIIIIISSRRSSKSRKRETARCLVSRRILLTAADGMRLLNPEKDALKEVCRFYIRSGGV